MTHPTVVWYGMVPTVFTHPIAVLIVDFCVFVLCVLYVEAEIMQWMGKHNDDDDDDVVAFSWMIHPDLCQSFQIGLGMGVILLTTLTLWCPCAPPTTTTTTATDNTKDIRTIEHNNKNNSSKKNNNNSSSNNNNNNNNNNNKKDVTKNTTTVNDNSSTTSTTSWSPHARMNFVVYVILIGTTLYILNQDYPGILEDVGKQYFPREAALLWGRR